MKKILLLLVVLVSSVTFAQNNGITYQAVIYSAKGESVPGTNNSNSPLANKAICLQFSIGDGNSSTEYQEKVTVTTDDFGMVNLVIGNGTQTGGYATSFNAISWVSSQKYLKVSVDQSGNCSSFELISDQILTYVPYALAANSAASVTGVVGIANGGTNAISVIGAKTNLQLQNVDNTSDLNKPLSTATQTALNLKVDKVNGKELSSNDYTNAEKTKLAAITGTNTGDQDLSALATNTNLNTKVDKVNGKELSSNDYTNAEKTKLAAITGTNTGDQDLSALATNSNLALKADTASPALSGIPTAPTAASGTNTTQLATTEFVINALGTSSSGASVDLTTNQTIAGSKTFSADILVNGITVGKGMGAVDGNTVFGLNALNANTTGSNNTANGANSLLRNTTGIENTANGYYSLPSNTVGNSNVANGMYSLYQNLTGSGNTASGLSSLFANTSGGANVADGNSSLNGNTTGNYNTGIGTNSLTNNTTGSNNSGLGFNANVGASNLTNATAIGANAIVSASDQIQLGNTAITNIKTSGTVTAGTVTYPNAHNNSNGQVLTVDAVGTASWTTASSSGVPYTGATGAVNLGAYDLTVNGLTVGTGSYTATFPPTTNSALGNYALFRNTSGNDNTANGNYSLWQNSTGGKNTSIGYYALNSNTTGSNNTAIGHYADVATGNLNNATAIGNFASVTASNTIQLGNTAITNVKTSGTITSGAVTYPNTHGTANQVLSTTGSGTLTWTTPSSGAAGVPYAGANAAVNLGGYDLTVNGLTIGSGKVGASATLNTIIGEFALNRSTVTTRGTDNTAIGHKSMGSETVSTTNAGSKNTAVGSWTLIGNSGQENSAMGNAAMEQNQGGNQNTAMGSRALNINSSGSNNTAIGYAADVVSNNLTNATAIGNGAKVAASNTIQLGNTDVTNVKTSGSITANDVKLGRGGGNFYPNTAVGINALNANVSGQNNTAVGSGALSNTTTGSYNVSLGNDALAYNTTGTFNVAIGAAPLVRNINGDSNIAIGRGTLGYNTSGRRNTAVGDNTLSNRFGNPQTGEQNTVLGYNAASDNASGSNNTIIGANANVTTSNLNNATAIGFGATVSADNTFQLGNTNVTNVKTSGTISAGGVTYPNAHGTAGQVLSTTGSGTLAWTTPASGGSSSTYTTGLNASVGGYIFYVTTDGKHGLVVDTQEAGVVTWYDAQNEVSISSNHSTAGKLFTDWRLPTRNEMSLLRNTTGLWTTTNPFPNSGYFYFWTGDEANQTDAWSRSLDGANTTYTYGKTNTRQTLSVRSF